MGKNEDKIHESSQLITSFWLSKVPRWFRYLLLYGGLLALLYFLNKEL